MSILTSRGSVGLTYRRISEYYQQAQHVIDRVAKLCIPGG